MARVDYEHLSREELLTVIERLEARITQQDAHILRLEARIKQPEDLLDQATRGGKRQAAPFSKGASKPDPHKPGRKPGDAYGRHAYRDPPIGDGPPKGVKAEQKEDDEPKAELVRCRHTATMDLSSQGPRRGRAG